MRRWLFLLWLALLAAPAAALFGPPERSSAREGRMLAQPPAMPASFEAWLALPRQVDAFVRDQFGFRDDMIAANARVRRSLDDEAGPDSPVVTGREGFLLLREGMGLSLGLETSPERAQRDAALICEMERRLARDHARFIFTIAPSTTTIYPEAAPEWMGAPRAPTNYDLLIAAARACGADTLDLRPPLISQRHAHLLYRRTDTHWTPRGALIAYDAIFAHLGLTQFGIDAGAIPWRTTERLGDLTRMNDAADATKEAVDTPDLISLGALPPTETMLPTPAEYLSMRTFVRDYPREGLSILVIGDSFAYDYFPEFLAPSVRRLTFMHHQGCGFDWGIVRRAEPDVVIYMPTERTANCKDGHRPEHFDSP